MIKQYCETLRILASASESVCTTAESCTAGMVSAAITEVAGSSRWFDRGFVTYSNEAKIEMLGVRSEILDAYGAVSNEVVKEMAMGALKYSLANISVSISGVAGPDGGTNDKPVGTVCFAWAFDGSVSGVNPSVWSEVQYFEGDRQQIRNQATERALLGLIALLDGRMNKFVRR